MSGSYRILGDAGSLQAPFDVAVVMPSVLRPTLLQALRSVLQQEFPGRIQVLIGIDKAIGSLEALLSAIGEIPRGRVISVLDPGYSTAERHGGLYPAGDGGALRCVLTYLANARHVAYLDDDNWWAADHIAALREAIEGKAWAFSHRFFVHPETDRVICVDEWESVGPGRGIFRKRFGGWSDPNCLMIDKIRCEPAIRAWNYPLLKDGLGMSADRRVFRMLAESEAGEHPLPTVYYRVNPADRMHRHRLPRMKGAWDEAARPAATPSPSRPPRHECGPRAIPDVSVSGDFRTIGDTSSLQTPFDVAVVMPSVLRPTLPRALLSVVRQEFAGRIQVLVGIDQARGSLDELIAALGRLPSRRLISFFDPGYSTSILHGGLYPAMGGGALRCILTYLANARYVAYLDDDNWWAPDHLTRLREAIEGKAWAFSHRFFTHPETGKVVCVDDWESVGPNRGIYGKRFGGWVDPNCWMIDKITCDRAIRTWNFPLVKLANGRTADRRVFRMLCQAEYGEHAAPTVFYEVSPKDGMHRHRLPRMGPAWDEAARPSA